MHYKNKSVAVNKILTPDLFFNQKLNIFLVYFCNCQGSKFHGLKDISNPFKKWQDLLLCPELHVKMHDTFYFSVPLKLAAFRKYPDFFIGSDGNILRFGYNFLSTGVAVSEGQVIVLSKTNGCFFFSCSNFLTSILFTVFCIW